LLAPPLQKLSIGGMPTIVAGCTASWRCVMAMAKKFGLEILPPLKGKIFR
jgi:hypothetical protein